MNPAHPRPRRRQGSAGCTGKDSQALSVVSGALFPFSQELSVSLCLAITPPSMVLMKRLNGYFSNSSLACVILDNHSGPFWPWNL